MQQPILALGSMSRDEIDSSLLSWDLVEKPAFEVLQKIYRGNPAVVLSSVLGLWESAELRPEMASFCDLNTSPFSDQFFKHIAALYRTGLSETFFDLLITFLHQCSSATINPNFTLEFWTLASILSKDALNGVAKFRSALPSLFAWATSLARTIADFADPDFRRTSRETQVQAIVLHRLTVSKETFYKLTEYAISASYKLIEPSQWSELPSAESSAVVSVGHVAAQGRGITKDLIALEMWVILVENFLPPAMQLVTDQEKYTMLMSLVFSSLVLPVLKGSVRYHSGCCSTLDAL